MSPFLGREEFRSLGGGLCPCPGGWRWREVRFNSLCPPRGAASWVPCGVFLIGFLQPIPHGLSASKAEGSCPNTCPLGARLPQQLGPAWGQGQGQCGGLREGTVGVWGPAWPCPPPSLCQEHQGWQSSVPQPRGTMGRARERGGQGGAPAPARALPAPAAARNLWPLLEALSLVGGRKEITGHYITAAGEVAPRGNRGCPGTP